MSDESVRRLVRDHQVAAGQAADGPRQTVELDRVESLRLLGSVSLGRIVFTFRALPAIRPVNHVLDNGDIIVLTHDGADLVAQSRYTGGIVVAYQADALDPQTHLGWSVIATGYAQLVSAPDEVARYRTMVRPWVSRTMAHVVRIRPDLVSGVRLTVVQGADGG